MRWRALLLLTTLALTGCAIGGGDEKATSEAKGGGGVAASGPPPTSSQPQAAQKLGFPTVATRNTVRVGGGDAAADLAGVASAVFPATTAQDRPDAVVLVDKDDWQAAIAGSGLNAQPLGAPLLAGDGGSLPAATPAVVDPLTPR